MDGIIQNMFAKNVQQPMQEVITKTFVWSSKQRWGLSLIGNDKKLLHVAMRNDRKIRVSIHYLQPQLKMCILGVDEEMDLSAFSAIYVVSVW